MKQTSGIPVRFQLVDQSKSITIAPGQTLPVVIKVEYKNSESWTKSADCADVNVVLKLVTDRGQDEKFDIKLRCRRLKESFLFTFVDHDGSVQHGAAIAPLQPCLSDSCPVLLTLHGTSKSQLVASDSPSLIAINKMPTNSFTR